MKAVLFAGLLLGLVGQAGAYELNCVNDDVWISQWSYDGGARPQQGMVTSRSTVTVAGQVVDDFEYREGLGHYHVPNVVITFDEHGPVEGTPQGEYVQTFVYDVGVEIAATGYQTLPTGEKSYRGIVTCTETKSLVPRPSVRPSSGR